MNIRKKDNIRLRRLGMRDLECTNTDSVVNLLPGCEFQAAGLGHSSPLLSNDSVQMSPEREWGRGWGRLS